FSVVAIPGLPMTGTAADDERRLAVPIKDIRQHPVVRRVDVDDSDPAGLAYYEPECVRRRETLRQRLTKARADLLIPANHWPLVCLVHRKRRDAVGGILGLICREQAAHR